MGSKPLALMIAGLLGAAAGIASSPAFAAAAQVAPATRQIPEIA